MSGDSPSASGRFPDLYGLLGLKPLEPDRARIQQSLQRLASQIQARSQTAAKDAASRAQVQRAHKLLELGKQQLLDPARKGRYDQQWQAVYGTPTPVAGTPVAGTPVAGTQPSSRSTESESGTKPRQRASVQPRAPTADRPVAATLPDASTASSPTWDLRELLALLPEGDSSAPFRPEEYLASRAPELAERYTEDFDKLLSLLTPSDAATTGSNAVASTAAIQTTHEKSAIMSLPSDHTPVQPELLSHPSATPLAQRLRKRQGPPLLWRAIGVLAAVGIVLGIAYWRLQPASDPSPDGSSLAAKSAQNTSPALPAVGDLVDAARQFTSPATSRESAPAQEPPVLRRSGLPSVPGIDALLPTSEAPNEGSAVGPDDTSSPGESAMQGSSMQDTAMTDVQRPDTAASSQSNPLSDGERQRWTEGMLAARDAIGQQQFAQATAQLDSLRALAKTQLQTQQLARLVTIEQLAQRFRRALDTALAGMGAAESFSFGNSNLASFVEAGGERVILRIEGANQTFAMPELPVELAFALVDMAMDRAHPQSLAAKAAFLLVHPAAQGDQRAAEQARQMMSAAVVARAVPQDMQQALQDDFLLP